MTLSRRNFLKNGIGVLGLCLSPAELLLTSADARASNLLVGANHLVIIHLSGGNDGLNTVIPYQSGHYYDARPELAIAQESVLALDKGIGLHPSMTGMAALYKDGQVAVVQSVGHANATRSHHRANQIWHSARTDLIEEKGWMELSSISGVHHSYSNTNLDGALESVAAHVSSESPPAIHSLTISGFDTHANQSRVHASLLRDLSDSVAKFQTKLKLTGADSNVITLIYSEFGRRLPVNGGDGTDHGTSGPVFVIGSSVHGGIYGDHPNLKDLENGDLKHDIDFRSIYATILDRHLLTDSQAVLGNHFEHIPFM